MKPHVSILEREERNYDFSLADFRRIQQMIYNHAGIKLSDAKHDMVYSRIMRRIRATGMETFAEYLDLTQREPAEWEAFVNSLTTNLTAFFREEYHFPILAEQMRAHPPGQKFRIWCSAASTGEEPYSLAITAIKAFDSWHPPVEIIATDIDTNVLAKADRGVYDSDRIARVGEDLSKYFLRGKGSNAGMIKVRPELRQLITFKQLNLLKQPWPLSGAFDALFCRNVLIYFDKETQRRVLEHFVPLMADDAMLYVGHSESLLHLGDLFRLRGKTVYERCLKDARAG